MSWLTAGWEVFPTEPAVEAWVNSVKEPALAAAVDPANAHWLRHSGTWFVGVDALDNDSEGRVEDGPALGSAAYDAAVGATGVKALHRAQVSVTYPGYPQQGREDSNAAHRFRLNRCAAHLDGLLPVGPAKRRFYKEPHAWILGLPLTHADANAAPLVVWEGSHHRIKRMFALAVFGHRPDEWKDIDLTDTYREARAEVFETCRRVEVPLHPGEAVLLHPMVIHGVASWAEGARADPAGRAIAYFRPLFEDDCRAI